MVYRESRSVRVADAEKRYYTESLSAANRGVCAEADVNVAMGVSAQEAPIMTLETMD